MITQSNGKIIQINPTFSALTGYEDYEVLGKNQNVISSGLHPPEYYQAMWTELSEKGVWQGEICNRKKSGDVHIVAEGVEKSEQKAFLERLGCDLIQGDLFCRPLNCEH